MKNEKGLAELIEKVKESSRQMGEPLTQNDIADRLGRNKSYLSGLKRGYENVSPQFVALFKQTFKKYLPPEEVDYDVGVVIKQIYTMNLVILDATAEIIAEQQGAHFYTIGQRKGLHIGGRPHPSFVLQTDTVHNIVFSGQLDSHPGLNRYALKINADEIHYVNPDYEMMAGDIQQMDVRIRYRQPLQKATLVRKQDGLYILFEELQRGITPGQFAAWYLGDELIGSGVIA